MYMGLLDNMFMKGGHSKCLVKNQASWFISTMFLYVQVVPISVSQSGVYNHKTRWTVKERDMTCSSTQNTCINAFI